MRICTSKGDGRRPTSGNRRLSYLSGDMSCWSAACAHGQRAHEPRRKWVGAPPLLMLLHTRDGTRGISSPLRAANNTERAAVSWARTARSEPQCKGGACRFRAPAAPAWRLRSRFVSGSNALDRCRQLEVRPQAVQEHLYGDGNQQHAHQALDGRERAVSEQFVQQRCGGEDRRGADPGDHQR